jgi:hypothetical protein
MKFEKWTVLTLFGIAMLVAIHQYIAFLFDHHGWKTMTAGDWGTWIGSIGTVGALLGTMWIATTESRRRRSEEVLRANITAAALAPRVELLANQLRAFRDNLMFENLEGAPYRSPAEEAIYILGITYLPATTEELMVLAALENGFASKLAYAQGRLDIICRAISEYVSASDGAPLQKRDAEKWERLGDELAERFSVIALRCTHAARTHAPPPTPEELYGP